jgi:hypothetical protein
MALGDVITKFDNIEVKRSSDLFRALDAHKVAHARRRKAQGQGNIGRAPVTRVPVSRRGAESADGNQQYRPDRA